jgi:transcriptional regulator with XRE-family HTH domain
MQQQPIRLGRPARRHSRDHDAFGDAIRVTRTRRRLSQEALGLRAGMHRNYVGAVERGEVNPTLRIMMKLASGLDLALSELLALAEAERGARAP